MVIIILLEHMDNTTWNNTWIKYDFKLAHGGPSSHYT